MNAHISMRPYQQAGREKIHAEWDAGRRSTLLVLPTGTGKTIVMAAVAEDQVLAGQRVLILAHRGELLDQAADKILNATGLRCAVEKAEQTCLDSYYRITVGSVQSEFSSELRASGINQSLYRVNLKLTASLRLILPGVSDTIQVSAEAAIAESIIVGDVPEVYTNVANEEDMLNLIPSDKP